MKKTLFALLLATAISTAPVSGAKAKEQELPVSSIILSTSGMAHFEHQGQVDGNATISLPARMDQVDDLLKSLMVFDSTGQLGGISLPGPTPLQQIFQDLPFNRAQLSNPVALLNTLQGAEVTIDGPARASGKLVRVMPEMMVLDDGRQIIRHHRLSLLTDGGLKQVVLEDLNMVKFEDPKLRAQLDRALDAVVENAARDRRTLKIDLKGAGKRPVGLAYVVEAPLWKAAYRFMLPKDKDSGFVQGWAVIENVTGNDWKDVSLTLVSGNPVTFRQPLYQPYFVPRDEVPVEVLGRVMPRMNTGTVGMAGNMEMDVAMEEAPMEMKDDGNYRGMRKGEMIAPQKMRAMNAPAPSVMGGDAMGMVMSTAPMDAMSSMRQAAARQATVSEDAATQVLYRFKDGFDLKAGHSMLLPFVSKELPMERVWLYQPDTHATHPLAAIQLVNKGDSGLPPGIITLYEESAATGGTSFVGDARLPVLAKGEKRLISYALDSKTKIDQKQESENTRGTITISDGVLKTAILYRTTTKYTVKAPAEENRLVILEHPRWNDYKLVQPDPKNVEVTDTHYRIRVPVKPGESRTVPVTLERKGFEQIALLSLGSNQLQAYATGFGQLDNRTRQLFAAMTKMRIEIDRIDQQIRELDQQRNEISNDQHRIRDNLSRTPSNSDLARRYLQKMNDQEDKLEDIMEERAELNENKNEKLVELKNFIAKIRL